MPQSSQVSSKPRFITRLRRVEPQPCQPALERPRKVRRRVVLNLVLVVAILGAGWRFVRLISDYPVWYDEAFIALTLITRDYAGLFQPPEFYQVVPIGFFLVEKLAIELFGPSGLVLRSVPFLAGLGSLALFYRFARRTVDWLSASLAIGIFSASYYLSRHGAEVKPYSIDVFLAMLSHEVGWSLWKQPQRRSLWLALISLYVVGLWFSYPLIFVGAGAGLMLTVRVARDPLRPGVRWLAAFAVLSLISWLGMYTAVGSAQSKAASFYPRSITWKYAFPPLDRPWRLPDWLLDVHTGNMLAYPYGGNNYGSITTTLFVAVGCFAMRRSGRALLCWLLSPLLFAFLASALHRYPYGTSARTMLFMGPTFSLLAGVGAARIIRVRLPTSRRAFVASSVLVVFSILLVGGSIYNFLFPFREVGDVENRKVARLLAEKARPGDRWIFHDGLKRIEVRDNLMVEHWVGQVAELRYNLLVNAPVPVEFQPDNVNPAWPSGRTWFIVYSSGAPDFNPEPINRIRSTLESSLGQPLAHAFPLGVRYKVEVFEFPPSHSTTSEPPSAPTPNQLRIEPR